MSRYFYDLHLHSCLSPCADDDMPPANIAGMASLKGLQLLALTDHNSCGNCETFLQTCRAYGIVGVPGMELTTAEEIHMVCLFPSLETALKFDKTISENRLLTANRPEIFGNQLYVDAEDNVTGEEPHLLHTACRFSLSEAYGLVLSIGGAAYPAHIDREANGIINVLGTFPPEPDFKAVEFNDSANVDSYTADYGLADRLVLCSSDAHHLWDIQEAGPSLELDDEPYSSDRVRQALIDLINKGLK